MGTKLDSVTRRLSRGYEHSRTVRRIERARRLRARGVSRRQPAVPILFLVLALSLTGSHLVSPVAAAPLRAPESAVAESLSVAECVSRARSAGPAVTAARLDWSATEFDSIAVSRNARPSMAIDVGSTVAPRGFYDPTVTNLGDYQAKLGIGWTLADGGGRLRERQRAALESGNAALSLTLQRRDAGLEAGALAIRTLGMQEAVDARREEIDWLQRLGLVVGAGVAAGTRGAADSVRIAVEVDAATAAFEDARLQLHAASRLILDAIGETRHIALAIRALPIADARGPTALDSARVLAGIERRSEVQQASVSSALGRLALEDAAHRSSPTFEIAADAGLAGADLTHAVPDNLLLTDPAANLGDRLRRDLGASLALRMHWPVHDAASVPAVEARRAALGAAGARESAERLRQYRLALTELEGWDSAARQLDAAEIALRRAQRSLLRVKSLYQGGGTSLLDLLDAWRSARDAQDRLQSARENYRIARMLVEDRS